MPCGGRSGSISKPGIGPDDGGSGSTGAGSTAGTGAGGGASVTAGCKSAIVV
jgi:hypothetical protein